MKRLFLIIFITLAVLNLQARRINVLAVGNSFSMDAVETHLWPLAAQLGDTLLIGNAYFGGCSIDQHIDHLEGNSPVYEYRKVTEGKLVNTKEMNLHDIIADEPWDIISVQQVSGLSGRTDSFGNLPQLLDSIRSIMPDKNAEIVWHRTWSYADDYRSDLYNYYHNDPKEMNDSIADVARKVPEANGIRRIVPAGDAVMNAREDFGDTVFRDGYHLSLPLGRYIASCAWAEFITGRPVIICSYKPEELSEKEAFTARMAAHRAFLKEE